MDKKAPAVRRSEAEGEAAELRLVSATATERLAARIAEHNGLTPDEGGEEAASAVRFFSALLGLPTPCHGPTPKATAREDDRSPKAA